MIIAKFKNELLAESENTVVIDGNHYFPEEDVRHELLLESDHHTYCPWKGEASYYHVKVEGDIDHNAAWYYPDPKDAAKAVKNRIAFWHGVEVSEVH